MREQLAQSSAIQPYSLEVSHLEVNGPLNLKETITSAQTSEPEWGKTEAEAAFTDIEYLNGIPIKFTLAQMGTVDDFLLKVNAIPSSTGEISLADLRSHLDRVLGLRDDLAGFYRKFSGQGDPLESTFSHLRGLRLMRGTSLYESLISSMLSQNNSALLWNRTARIMMKLYGKKVSFPDGTETHLFPRPEALARLRPRELQSKTSMGYRAKPVVEVSRLVVKGELSLDSLVGGSYEEAMEELLELPGVGPKVADCFLLYGAGKLEAAPVDVWIHRIVSRLYFKGGKVSRLKTARFLRERFRDWAGYAQLYLFDFARREDLTKTKKASKSPETTVG